MKCANSLAEDIKRFYVHFDGVYFRRYTPVWEVVFSPYQYEVDVFARGILVLHVDKYKRVHLYKNRIYKWIVPTVNAICTQLNLCYRFDFSKSGVWYSVPIPENDLDNAVFTSIIEYS